MGAAAAKVITPSEQLAGARVSLRLIVPEDCSAEYLRWLQEPQVNRFLETRWQPQSMESIRAFVSALAASPDDYLFGIFEAASASHVGNIKIGPVHRIHRHADVSYFIGKRSAWGRGYATEAIALAVAFAFERLRLHRLQAGIYAGNRGSARVLEKNGFRLEGCFRQQLRVSQDGGWEDHVWYGLLADDWRGARA